MGNLKNNYKNLPQLKYLPKIIVFGIISSHKKPLNKGKYVLRSGNLPLELQYLMCQPGAFTIKLFTGVIYGFSQ